jgi:hypothetical protein
MRRHTIPAAAKKTVASSLLQTAVTASNLVNPAFVIISGLSFKDAAAKKTVASSLLQTAVTASNLLNPAFLIISGLSFKDGPAIGTPRTGSAAVARLAVMMSPFWGLDTHQALGDSALGVLGGFMFMWLVASNALRIMSGMMK